MRWVIILSNLNELYLFISTTHSSSKTKRKREKKAVNSGQCVGINDRTEEENVVIPDYRKNVVLMRCDIRQSKYFEEPQRDKALQSIDGQSLHPNLSDIFKISRQR